MSQTESFKVHDLVWGKMKSFPPWPGMVVDPSDENIGEKPKKSNNYCVYFFGSHNFTWLDEKCVQPYQEFKQAYSNISKQASFLEAVKLIEEYIESGATGLPPSREKPKKKSIVNGNTSSQGFATPKDKVRKRKSIPQKSFSSLDNYEKFPKTPRLRLSLIDRPPRSDPEIAVTDLKDVSQNLKDKKIIPTSMTIGFLGLGIMGSRIAKNILLSGHKLMVWNRTPSKSEQFEEAGAEVGPTPADVILGSDITFSCVSDPKAAKELVFGNCGVLSEMSSGKGFVELTSIDADTSKEIADSIHEKGGRYLEAQMVGSLHEVEEGKLVFLCAGDESLFNDCQTCFRSCSERTPNYLGPTGSAVNMNLVYQAIQGIMVASLAEGLSLLQRMDLPQNVFLEAFKRSSVYCPLFEEKINMILNEKFPTSLPLQHHQKDLKLALTLGTEVGQPMPLTAAVNELYKHARRLGFGEHDTSSVYVRSKY